MRWQRFFNVLILLVLLAASGGYSAPVSAMPHVAAAPDSVIFWNGVAVETIVSKAGYNPSQATVPMAYVHLAIYDAVVAIEGGYTPYAKKIKAEPGASVDAAVAKAARDVLAQYFPQYQAALDDYYNAQVPDQDDPAVKAGVSVGQEAAAALINKRKSDGFLEPNNIKLLKPGPGVFELQANQTLLNTHLAKMKPFLLESKDQVRPAGPTPLTGQQYLADYNEVVSKGRDIGSTRTPEETEGAWYFTPNAIPMYNPKFKEIVAAKGMNAVQAARLYAKYAIIADANIACYDAKYKFNFWRPITAIQQAEYDGNPGTVPVAGWKPLIGTPPFPEYTSGHGCLTASTAEVWAEAMGTRDFNFTLYSGAPNVVNRNRSYSSVDQLIQDIIDVRVWSGIHFRTSDVDGVNIGKQVAAYGFANFFLPTE